MKKSVFNSLVAVFLLLLCNIARADGFIIVPPVHQAHNPYPLDVLYHNVTVKINGNYAVTEVDESFYNPLNQRLEGLYIFPIPENTIINGFTMTVDGVTMTAELIEAGKAREIYEEIVRKAKDPALLEYMNRGLFKLRIFPIEPRSERKIKLSYIQLLKTDGNNVSYLYPLNTEKFSASLIKKVSVKVDVNPNFDIRDIYCPTHNCVINKTGKRNATVEFVRENSKPDTDFELIMISESQGIAATVLANQKPSEQGYFLLNLMSPLLNDKSESIPKNVIFVTDISGSMAGKKIQSAIKAVNYCVQNLKPEDKFEIIKFSTEAEELFSNLLPANQANIKKAQDFVDKFKPTGGTNIDEALSLALKKKDQGNEQYPTFIVFITDGKPTIGERDEDKILKKIASMNTKGAKIFSFGIGDDLNVHLLDKISLESNALSTYLATNEEIELKLSSFFDKISHPFLSGVKITFPSSLNTTEVFPKKYSDLFYGSSLILTGLFEKEGSGQLLVSGKVNGVEKEYKIDFSIKNENSAAEYVPLIWASRKIGYLLDLMRLHGESEELKTEVVKISKKFGLITPYTSFLIVEDDKIKPQPTSDPRFQTFGRGNVEEKNFSRYQSEYNDFSKKEGQKGTQASKDMQDMNMAPTLETAGNTRNGYYLEDGIGEQGKVENMVKFMEGRAFYKRGDWWIDSYLSLKKPSKENSVLFLSDEYFKLIQNKGLSNKILALGSNVRVMHNGEMFEIRDK